MTTTTVVVGLLLAFLLFTVPGRLIIGVVSVAVTGGAVVYLLAWSGVFPILILIFFGYAAVSGFIRLNRAGERVLKERRERAARVWALEHPLEGDILPPQRHLSP